MKKYLIAFVAIIFALGLNSFTTVQEIQKKGTTIDLHWYEYSTTSGVGTYLDFGERDNFKVFGCESTVGSDCRRGYDEGDLIDDSDPDLGVANPNANLSQIKAGQ